MHVNCVRVKRSDKKDPIPQIRLKGFYCTVIRVNFGRSDTWSPCSRVLYNKYNEYNEYLKNSTRAMFCNTYVHFSLYIHVHVLLYTTLVIKNVLVPRKVIPLI